MKKDQAAGADATLGLTAAANATLPLAATANTMPARTTPATPARTKLAFRVSGARVGDSVRPASDAPAIAAAPRFGLRVHRTIAAIAPCKTSAIAAEDYATADEDYT